MRTESKGLGTGREVGAGTGRGGVGTGRGGVTTAGNYMYIIIIPCCDAYNVYNQMNIGLP